MIQVGHFIGTTETTFDVRSPALLPSPSYAVSNVRMTPSNPKFRIAPRVVFLPIVTRELRVASRRPKTYYGRMLVAAFWVAIAAYVLFVISQMGFDRSGGLVLFNGLSGGLFGWALLSAWAGCDSISVEKREGTVGLLFLTDLKSHDIVLGKMFSSALPSFYAALAALPLLAICMLMGGITATHYAKTGLAILNVFFFCQAVGVFSSALCRLRGNAVGLPLLILLMYLPCCGIVAAVADVNGSKDLAFFIQLNNPAHTFVLASAASSARIPAHEYWLSLLAVHLHAWIFLGLACWVLPRRWRDKPKIMSGWKRTWERWRYGRMTVRTAFRRRLASVNPFLWLVCRGRFSPAFVWCIMGIVAMMTLVISAIQVSQDSWADSYDGCFVFIIVTLQLMLRMGVPAHAALLEGHRRNGSLETILCCTPLSVDDILDGMWLVVRRYYLWPAMFVVAAQGLMFIAALVTGQRHSLNVGLLCFIGASILLLIPDLLAMAWMAMWTAMSNPRPRSAGATALFWISMFPWMLVSVCFATRLVRSEYWVWPLWLIFGLTNDVLTRWIAQKRLRENFRLWANPSYGEVLGFWGRLGRFFGLLRRRWRPSPRPAA